MSNKDLAKRLRKFSKEQIIEAITECYQAEFLFNSIISSLEYKAEKELLDAHAAAIDAEREAAKACMDWRSEMCDKYGHGGECKLVDIPQDEIAKGAKLEREWIAAQEKEKALDKKVSKALGIGGAED